jgi:predicted GNAT family N-acyltransferase
MVYSQERGYAPEDDLDAIARHLVALDSSGQVVAYARLIPPAHRPFDIERFVELRSLVPDWAIPAEVGRLCVRSDHRLGVRGQYVQLGIFKLTCLVAKTLQITHLVMYAFEELRGYYQAVSFKDSGIAFFHPGYARTMRAMCLDLNKLSLCEGGAHERLARFLLSPDPQRFKI